MAVASDSGLGGEAGSQGRISKTDAFDILGNERRRHALHHLMRVGSADIRELSRQVAAWENGIVVERVESNQRRRVYVALHQTHLPRMDEMGVLRYESTRDTIELTDAGRNLRVYMEVVDVGDIPWSEFYLGLRRSPRHSSRRRGRTPIRSLSSPASRTPVPSPSRSG